MSSERDEQQATLLEEYAETLMGQRDSQPPAELEAGIAETTRQVRESMRAPLPSARFIAALQEQLEQEAASTSPAPATAPLPMRKRQARPIRLLTSAFSRLAAAALLVLAVAGALYVASDLANKAQHANLPQQPDLHSADEIIAHAKAMYQSDTIKSFEATQVSMFSNENQLHDKWRFYYQAPDLWRSANTYEMEIDNGKAVWGYSAPISANYGGDVTVSTHDNTFNHLMPAINNYIERFNNAIFDINGCYNPTLIGTDSVAGRPTYILDLGEPLSGCTNIGLTAYGKQVLWLDHDSFFVLKDELYYRQENGKFTSLVTEVQYNVALPSNLFTFVMPKNVNITDNRGAATSDDFRAQTAEMASAISFTTYLPAYLPESVKASNLRYSTKSGQLDINYSQPETMTPNPQPPEGLIIGQPYSLAKQLTIMMRQATVGIANEETKGLPSITINGKQLWVSKRDGAGCTDPGTTTICIAQQKVIAIFGNTLVEVYGDGFTDDELEQVAASLHPITPKLASGPAFPTLPVIATPVPTDSSDDLVQPIPSVVP